MTPPALAPPALSAATGLDLELQVGRIQSTFVKAVVASINRWSVRELRVSCSILGTSDHGREDGLRIRIRSLAAERPEAVARVVQQITSRRRQIAAAASIDAAVVAADLPPPLPTKPMSIADIFPARGWDANRGYTGIYGEAADMEAHCESFPECLTGTVRTAVGGYAFTCAEVLEMLRRVRARPTEQTSPPPLAAGATQESRRRESLLSSARATQRALEILGVPSSPAPTTEPINVVLADYLMEETGARVLRADWTPPDDVKQQKLEAVFLIEQVLRPKKPPPTWATVDPDTLNEDGRRQCERRLEVLRALLLSNELAHGGGAETWFDAISRQASLAATREIINHVRERSEYDFSEQQTAQTPTTAPQPSAMAAGAPRSQRLSAIRALLESTVSRHPRLWTRPYKQWNGYSQLRAAPRQRAARQCIELARDLRLYGEAGSWVDERRTCRHDRRFACPCRLRWVPKDTPAGPPMIEDMQCVGKELFSLKRSEFEVNPSPLVEPTECSLYARYWTPEACTHSPRCTMEAVVASAKRRLKSGKTAAAELDELVLLFEAKGLLFNPLPNGSRLPHVSSNTDPPLVRFARAGDRRMVIALLLLGTHVDDAMQWTEGDQWTWGGDSSLMAAAREGNGALVALLLAHGASTTHRCCYSCDHYETPAEAARRAKQPEMAALINAGLRTPPSLMMLAAKSLPREHLVQLDDMLIDSLLGGPFDD